jgi:hypothetical protein
VPWEPKGVYYVRLTIFDGFLVYSGVTKVKHNFDAGVPRLNFNGFTETKITDWGTAGPISIYINGVRFVNYGKAERLGNWLSITGSGQLTLESARTIFKINAKAVDGQNMKVGFSADAASFNALQTANFNFFLTAFEDARTYLFQYEADGIKFNFTEFGSKEGNLIKGTYTGPPIIARDKYGKGPPIELSNIVIIVHWWFL